MKIETKYEFEYGDVVYDTVNSNYYPIVYVRVEDNSWDCSNAMSFYDDSFVNSALQRGVLKYMGNVREKNL